MPLKRCFCQRHKIGNSQRIKKKDFHLLVLGKELNCASVDLNKVAVRHPLLLKPDDTRS